MKKKRVTLIFFALFFKTQNSTDDLVARFSSLGPGERVSTVSDAACKTIRFQCPHLVGRGPEALFSLLQGTNSRLSKSGDNAPLLARLLLLRPSSSELSSNHLLLKQLQSY